MSGCPERKRPAADIARWRICAVTACSGEGAGVGLIVVNLWSINVSIIARNSSGVIFATLRVRWMAVRVRLLF
jgi:hypothetical protein